MDHLRISGKFLGECIIDRTLKESIIPFISERKTRVPGDNRGT